MPNNSLGYIVDLGVESMNLFDEVHYGGLSFDLMGQMQRSTWSKMRPFLDKVELDCVWGQDPRLF